MKALIILVLVTIIVCAILITKKVVKLLTFRLRQKEDTINMLFESISLIENDIELLRLDIEILEGDIKQLQDRDVDEEE